MIKWRFIVMVFISLNTFAQKDTMLLDTVFLKTNHFFEQNISLSTTNTSLSAELSKSGGVFVKDYGLGNLATVNYQGSSSAQTALYWSNVNLSPANSSVTDYSLIDSYLFDFFSLETSQNSRQASGIGADIIVGSIAVADSGLSGSNFFKVGSFNDYKIGVKTTYLTKSYWHKFSVLGGDAKNNFRFYHPINQQFEYRANNQNRFLGWHFLGKIKLNQKTNLQLNHWARTSKRGIPSPVHVANQFENQDDSFARNVLSLLYNVSEKSKISAQIGYLYEFYFY
jgi:hypothetical protein